MKYLFLILSFVLLLQACVSPNGPGQQQGVYDQPCTSFKEGKGLVVDFLEDQPPAEIFDQRPFTLGLVFANHFDEPITAELFLDDSVDYSGFPEDGISQSVVIEPAQVEEGRWYGPGCRVDGLAQELYLGPFTYPPIPFGKDAVQFYGSLSYPAHTDYSFWSCVYNPVAGMTSSCQTPPISTWENDKAPLSITHIDHKPIGSPDGVQSLVDITITNLGGGSLGSIWYDQSTFDFTFTSDQHYFYECSSPQQTSNYGNKLTLTLDERKQAHITCESFISLDRPETALNHISLDYQYTYSFGSGVHSIVKRF